MLNKYPLWKNALIVLILLIGGLYAAPNLYPDDYAVQISGSRAAYTVDQQMLNRVTKQLQAEGLVSKTSELNGASGLIRFTDSATQLEAKKRLAVFSVITT